MAMFRCFNAVHETYDGPPGKDFEAELPVCPSCLADGRKNPNLVIGIATIHYLVIDPDGPIRTPNGNRRVACQPAAKRLPKHATGEPSAATCQACKATDGFLEHVATNVVQDAQVISDGTDEG